MAVYQVAIIERPEQWTPGGPDDVPPVKGRYLEVLAEEEELFRAVRKAIAHNEQAESDRVHRWAVVVEAGDPEEAGATARLCTPITYKATTIWWPEGWEPNCPLDVPNCVRRVRDRLGSERLTYQGAMATVNSLNRQCIDRADATWHVIVAVENEPVSRTTACDPSGTETTVEVRRFHVIRPEEAGSGDCSHCPAHSFPCATAEWDNQPQTVTIAQSRSAQQPTE